MATANSVDSTDFVALLVSKMSLGKDKETDTKKHLVTFTKMVFDDPNDKIKRTQFLYLDDEPDLKTGRRYSVSASYDTDRKRWVADSITEDDDMLDFEAIFIGASKWQTLKTKKNKEDQMWKFNLRDCRETDNDDNKPWGRGMTFYYVDDDGDEIKDLKKNCKYEFRAIYGEDQKAWEIQSWDEPD